jgi:hypothetical protein
MQYLLLIYESEAAHTSRTPEQNEAVIGGYLKFDAELKETGKMLGGDALQPTMTATSVRVRDGKALTTDGPFAETKEQLGGFYLVDVANLDEALALAAKIPTANTGTIEVRPVMKFDDEGNLKMS